MELSSLMKSEKWRYSQKKSKRDEFTDKIKEREDTEIVEVTLENRNELIEEMIRKIKIQNG